MYVLVVLTQRGLYKLEEMCIPTHFMPPRTFHFFCKLPGRALTHWTHLDCWSML